MCFIRVGDLYNYMRNEEKKIVSKQKKEELAKSILNKNGLGNRVSNIIKNVYSNKSKGLLIYGK